MAAYRLNTPITQWEKYGVLLDSKSGEYWELNPSAAVVARTLLDGGGSAEAVGRLTDTFEVDKERARPPMWTPWSTPCACPGWCRNEIHRRAEQGGAARPCRAGARGQGGGP